MLFFLGYCFFGSGLFSWSLCGGCFFSRRFLGNWLRCNWLFGYRFFGGRLCGGCFFSDWLLSNWLFSNGFLCGRFLCYWHLISPLSLRICGKLFVNIM